MVAYEGKEPYVFVSYAHKDKNKVMPLVEGLQKRGFRVWYDKRGISAGSEWAEVIADHLENCRCMVTFVSRSFGASNNCREELNYAKELKKTILVIYLEDRQNLRGAVRMQLSTLHSMSLDDYADHGEFLNELSGEEAMQPCLGAAVQAESPAPAPVKPAGPTPEELWQQGDTCYEKKEYDAAVKLWKKAADLGYASAQKDLGWCYSEGLGVTQNDEEAVKWYYKAAEMGDAFGQRNLGYCYRFGKGVTQNKEEAVKWYRKAAEQGDSAAQFNLGLCYKNGTGVRQNKAEARKWLQKAADQGNQAAADELKKL